MSASADKITQRRGTPKRLRTAGKTSSLSFKSTGRKQYRKSGRRSSKVRRRENSVVLHWLCTLIILIVVSFGAYKFLIEPYSYRWKPCYGSKAYDICIPNGYSVYGIDISHHQGNIEWSRMMNSLISEYPICFVMVKATEGGNYKDPNFESNRDSVRKVGLIFGAYHFYNPETSPITQADFFTRNVSLQKGDLPPVIDVERRVKNKAIFQRDLLNMLQIVENHYGVRPIIYTSVKFRSRYLNSPVFDKYHFWIAHYYVEHPVTEQYWEFWQCSDKARIDGISENTDLNVFAGSSEQLRSMLF